MSLKVAAHDKGLNYYSNIALFGHELLHNFGGTCSLSAATGVDVGLGGVTVKVGGTGASVTPDGVSASICGMGVNIRWPWKWGAQTGEPPSKKQKLLTRLQEREKEKLAKN